MKLRDINLSTRITLSALALVTLGAFGLLFLEENYLRNAYLDGRNADLQEAARVESLRLNQTMDTLRRDALFLSNTPPISGIIRATHNNGLDARYHNTTAVWQERLQQIFTAFSDAHPEYYQLRYIGLADGGRELVRIDRRDGRVEVAPPELLQQKGERGYFRAGLGLGAGQTHLSAIDCNQENGKVEYPCRLTVRSVAPVFGEDGKLFGMVVINREAAVLMESAALGVPPGVEVFVADAGGSYLMRAGAQGAKISPDPSQEKEMARDFPALKTVFDPQTSPRLPLHKVNGRRGYMAVERVTFNPDDPAGFLVLAYHLPAAAVVQQTPHMPEQHILVGLLSMLLVGGMVLVLLRRTFAPLVQLAEAADMIKAGGYDFKLPELGNSEIGRLVQAINTMLDQVLRREQQILQLNENLEERVNERTEELQRANRLLSEVVARNRAMMQNSMEGIHILDIDGNVVEANEAFCAMMGYSHVEVMRLNVADWDAQWTQQELRERIKGFIGRSGLFETRHRRKDGSLIDVEICVSGGEVEGKAYLFASSRDITERKSALAVLERHHMVLETALDGYWMTDLDGVLEEANEAYAKMSGYTVQELVGMRITNLEAKEKPEDTRAHIEKLMTEGYDRFETRHRRKDGSVMDIEVSVTLMPEQRKLFVFSRDITERKKAQRAMQRYHLVLETAMDGFWMTDMEGVLEEVNEAYARMSGYAAHELEGMHISWLEAQKKPEDTKAHIEKIVAQGHDRFETRHRRKDGSVIDVEVSVNSMPEHGKLFVFSRDITARKRIEQELRVAAATFETHDAIVITDAQSNIIRVNHAFSEITGYSIEEVLGKNPKMLSAGRQDKAFYEHMWQQLTHAGSWSGEIWDRRKNGEIYPKWLTITAVMNNSGETVQYVGIFSDITERKKAEEEIRSLAFYDPLTHLPNRRLFLERLRTALPASARHDDYGALMFLDMDKFKVLNDTLGHDYGDLMLVEVAKRIKTCVREMDTVARLGGDEFTVLIEGIAGDGHEASRKAGTVAEKIREALTQPYRLNGHEYLSSPSIGITLFHGNVEPVETLIKHADLAMYQAKNGGRNLARFYDPVMQENAERHDALVDDLRYAVGRDELRLYYQVQVDGNQHPVGAEALLRWQHPQRGLVLPDEFIHVAEERALIIGIGKWVLEEACAQLARWRGDARMGKLALVVNISPCQFAEPDFVGQVAGAVERHGIAPALLKLELTESLVLGDLNLALEKMLALRAIGISLSMDDFDTVYSSLFYLKQLVSDQIKIHRDVVRSIGDGQNAEGDAQLVQAIVGLAKSMQLDVHVEGVETEEQLAYLKRQGCRVYQGFLFGKPLPLAEFEALLEKLQCD